ncbi:MAG: preprotein translocase subunit SecG [Gammaproteobacteria bacterium]|jgi:preprotein translocase subunit SecG|nr:preprotein translocase subunit SecG [Gammaproteobacteria bacterium]MBT3867527.1 preprotein translocase subunit SecG [Gammaproteobacteria bacterium]MBT4378738.1 preprotein translocase subunit SecG [Gammaproteobacteria bacterium]MBT4617678.1 preprotein translocase subunit SecG [Gammaproteobacteria bacterium]MBT5199002.1 preprotein translocase subunit SecG [Gammaproteobacteria bacterium]
METIETLVLVFHVLAALAVIGLVLIQHGKGADAGAGFGGGASSTVFGSGGAGNFLQRMTTGIAIAFFLTSFGLAFYAKETSQAASGVGIPVVVETPAVGVQEDEEGELPAFESLEQDSEIPEG